MERGGQENGGKDEDQKARARAQRKGQWQRQHQGERSIKKVMKEGEGEKERLCEKRAKQLQDRAMIVLGSRASMQRIAKQHAPRWAIPFEDSRLHMYISEHEKDV